MEGNGFDATVSPFVTIGTTAGYTNSVDITATDERPAGSVAQAQAGLAIPVYYIDTMIRVTGYNFGQSIDIPVRFVRKVEA